MKQFISWHFIAPLGRAFLCWKLGQASDVCSEGALVKIALQFIAFCISC